MYGRINLAKINYDLDKEIIHTKPNFQEANDVFIKYCRHKDFDSVHPLYQDDINLYAWNCLYEKDKLVAWEQTLLYPNDKVAFSQQFAWDYEQPWKRIGWRFSYHVPAWLKKQGYKYLYLGDHHEYKSKIKGYEVLAHIDKHVDGSFEK